MDAHGGLPEWWQWFVPRYGKYGCPGWSSGRWCKDLSDTVWTVDAVDAMDALFKAHDRAYQTGGSWLDADTDLVRGLCRVRVDGAYARAYRVGAVVWFGFAICRLGIFGDKRLEVTSCGSA